MLKAIQHLKSFGIVEPGVLHLIQQYSQIEKFKRSTLSGGIWGDAECDFCTAPNYCFVLDGDLFLQNPIMALNNSYIARKSSIINIGKRHVLATCSHCDEFFKVNLPKVFLSKCLCGERAEFLQFQRLYCKTCLDKNLVINGLTIDEAIQLHCV